MCVLIAPAEPCVCVCFSPEQRMCLCDKWAWIRWISRQLSVASAEFAHSRTHVCSVICYTATNNALAYPQHHIKGNGKSPNWLCGFTQLRPEWRDLKMLPLTPNRKSVISTLKVTRVGWLVLVNIIFLCAQSLVSLCWDMASFIRNKILSIKFDFSRRYSLDWWGINSRKNPWNLIAGLNKQIFIWADET